MNQEENNRPSMVGDTNFWVSAIIGSGLCYKLSQLIFEGKIHHFTSLKLLSELTDVLRRHFGYSDAVAYSWYKNIGAISTVVYPEFGVLEQIQASRNHTDNPLLECAVYARADYLVTRDKDLLVLHPFTSFEGRPFSGIQIVTPEDFLEDLIQLGVVASRQL